MNHSFSHADGSASAMAARHDSEPSPANDVSYVQLMPGGWAWYRLSVIDDQRRELTLVEASDPGFVFETRQFSINDANAEQHFSELGLFFVDAPPAETSKSERRAIAESLHELVDLSEEVRQAKEIEAERMAGWQGVMRFFGGGGHEEKKDIPALERKIQSLRERFMDLCRQANENSNTEEGEKPGVRSTSFASFDGQDLGKKAPSKRHEEALRSIIARVFHGIEDVSRIHENLKNIKLVTVAGLAQAPIDESVRQNITALIEEARAKGIDVTPEEKVENIFDALAAQEC